MAKEEDEIIVDLSKYSVRSLDRIDFSAYPLELGEHSIPQRAPVLYFWGQLTLLLLFVASIGLLPELLVLVLIREALPP